MSNPSSGVDVQGVAVMDVVVDERREQVVSRGNCREVPREVEVDIDHRHDLAVAASCGATLHAEDRAHRGLPQCDDGILAQPGQPVSEPDRGRRLALAGGRGGDGRDQDQRARLSVDQTIDVVQCHLGLVMAIGHEMVSLYPERVVSQGEDGREVGGFGDLEVGRERGRAGALGGGGHTTESGTSGTRLASICRLSRTQLRNKHQARVGDGCLNPPWG